MWLLDKQQLLPPKGYDLWRQLQCSREGVVVYLSLPLHPLKRLYPRQQLPKDAQWGQREEK